VLTAGRQDEDAQHRVGSDQLLADLDSGLGGQVQVEHEDVGGGGLGAAHGLFTVARGGHHVEPGLVHDAADEVCEAAAAPVFCHMTEVFRSVLPEVPENLAKMVSHWVCLAVVTWMRLYRKKQRKMYL